MVLSPTMSSGPEWTATEPSRDESAVTSSLDAQSPENGRRTWVARLLAGCGSAFEWCFGLASLVAALAVLAGLPVLQFLSLGYLLESSGRAARTGRLRSGLFGVRKAARIGSLVLGTWLMLLPLRILSDTWYSSHLIDADSVGTGRWHIGLIVCTGLMIVHILAAWYCGGRLRHFFWPLLAPIAVPFWGFRKLLCYLVLDLSPNSQARSFSRRLASELLAARPLREWFVPAMLWDGLRHGRTLAYCRDAVWEFAVSLRLPYLFSMGLRGFFGAMAWLFIPVVLLIGATTLPSGAGVLSGLAGGLLLLIVVTYLPLLQAQFAADNRLGAIFQVGRIRKAFLRAPVAFCVALLATLLFALPLYLLMIELTPREVVFLPSLVFVAFILPARLLSGWALGRARRREQPRHFAVRLSARLATLPVASFYVLIVFFTRYTSWYGVWSLFEQPAFLIPVPFLSL